VMAVRATMKSPQQMGGAVCHGSAHIPPSVFLAVLAWAAMAAAGPYTEPGVNGYVDPNGRPASPDQAEAVVNPIFRAWATAVVDYRPAGGVSEQWLDASKTLGPATGDGMGIASLGDRSAAEIAAGAPPGWIVLGFTQPMRDGRGYDFVVFENAIVSGYNTGAGSVSGQMFGELAFVEVSSDGVQFARFPSVSLTPDPVGAYGTIELSNVFNLAGKHPNGGGVCTGTPFDLADLADEPSVRAGAVDVHDIRYVRIVDIPGNGHFQDAATFHIDPAGSPSWAAYTANHPVYDAWPTFGSGGFDLDAVGVLCEQAYSADINFDGVVDGVDFALFSSAWGSWFGGPGWIARCDLDPARDLRINADDLAALAAQWLGEETWRWTGGK